MATTGASWSWDIPEEFASQSSHQNQHGAFTEDEPAHQEAPAPEPEPRRRRHYPSRQCRICLETVQPTFETPTEGIAAMFNPTPQVTYISEDPELGRLMRPCKCKGSQKYVHEGCLTAWRYVDPFYGARNFYECPTCKFRYRLQRMKWGRWISSAFAQLCLTMAILFATIFVMGFVADPIINLYLDPYETLVSLPSMGGTGPALHIMDAEATTWAEHLLKGLASLGMLGFVKIFFAMSPWHWWNIRQTGVFGGGGARAGTGRNRLQNISWTLVIIGVGAFLVTVWKWTRGWSRAALEKAGASVIDVGGDDIDDEEDEDEQAEVNEQVNEEAAREEAAREEHPSTPVDSETRKTQ